MHRTSTFRRSPFLRQAAQCTVISVASLTAHRTALVASTSWAAQGFKASQGLTRPQGHLVVILGQLHDCPPHCGHCLDLAKKKKLPRALRQGTSVWPGTASAGGQVASPRTPHKKWKEVETKRILLSKSSISSRFHEDFMKRFLRHRLVASARARSRHIARDKPLPLEQTCDAPEKESQK